MYVCMCIHIYIYIYIYIYIACIWQGPAFVASVADVGIERSTMFVLLTFGVVIEHLPVWSTDAFDTASKLRPQEHTHAIGSRRAG